MSQDSYETLRQHIHALRRVLKKAEVVSRDTWPIRTGGVMVPLCPLCKRTVPNGEYAIAHDPFCEWVLVMKQTETA